MSVHIFGIRHHGPGSSKSVVKALEALQPDVVLVEGPPDAEAVLSVAEHIDMQPPVALLVYQPEAPQRAAFYPFAEFSPEWQAIQYAFRYKLPLRFMDLPLTHYMALEEQWQLEKPAEEPELVLAGEESDELVEGAENQHRKTTEVSEEEHRNSAEVLTEESGSEEILELEKGRAEDNSDSADEHRKSAEVSEEESVHADPVTYLAEVAGYPDGELWWEHMFEHREGEDDPFEAITEMMSALRENFPEPKNKIEPLREAWMRRVIRSAEKEGYQKIAVICGAWHAPALATLPPKKHDDELLKNLPKVKVSATWIPWTYSRLSFYSGYGAGVNSPGWYSHLWNFPEDDGTQWLALVARLFRQKNMDTSSAHIIEAVRLARTLASLRGRQQPGLTELNEAVLSVMCFGNDILLQLVHNELIVGKKIGQVPEDSPAVPLQQDLQKLQKKLRLPSVVDSKTYTLDLRQPNDLERSKLLHRLRMLDVPWGKQLQSRGKGTFKEQWELQWQPEMFIKLVEMGVWGNTVEEAASQYAIHTAKNSTVLAEVAALLEKTVTAELPHAVEKLMCRVDELAALGADIAQLMQALPPLVQISRYGNVRRTDAQMVQQLIEKLTARISVGLPAACFGLDEEASEKMLVHINAVHESLQTLQDAELSAQWLQSLKDLSEAHNIHALLIGRSVRILSDAKALTEDEVTQKFSLALSIGNEANFSAYWLEGFLRGSGMVLLLDELLWNLLNQWVHSLEDAVFLEVLPLLRRNFSTFSSPERRKIGEKAKGSGASSSKLSTVSYTDFDVERAKKSLPVVAQLLGLN